MKIRRSKLEVGVPAVAMADIAFNLVLFFIILARTQDNSYHRWKPASVPTAEKIRMAKVVITVDDTNKVFLNNDQVSVEDPAQLASAIEKKLGDKPAGERTVLLKIHKDTQAATFEKVIAGVSQAGGEIVHVLAKDGENQ